jgi:hypothetical protein
LSLKEVLLSAGDIERIPGGPLNVTVSKVNDASGIYEDPDPRLPCGRKAPNFNASHAVDELFSMPQVGGFEAVAKLPAPVAHELFHLNESNVRVGCSYQSRTNSGTVQTSTLVKLIPMPHLTNQAFGLVVVVRNNGQTYGTYEMIMSEGSTVAGLYLIATTPVKTTFMVALAQTVEERLLGHIAA